MRKKLQIDNLNELPKEKRPTDEMLFEGSSEELDSWLDKVISGKTQTEFHLEIDEKELE